MACVQFVCVKQYDLCATDNCAATLLLGQAPTIRQQQQLLQVSEVGRWAADARCPGWLLQCLLSGMGYAVLCQAGGCTALPITPELEDGGAGWVGAHRASPWLGRGCSQALSWLQHLLARCVPRAAGQWGSVHTWAPSCGQGPHNQGRGQRLGVQGELPRLHQLSPRLPPCLTALHTQDKAFSSKENRFGRNKGPESMEAMPLRSAQGGPSGAGVGAAGAADWPRADPHPPAQRGPWGRMQEAQNKMCLS